MGDHTVTRHLLKRHQEVASLATELNASLNDEVMVAFVLLIEAISNLPPGQREERLRAIEEGKALRISKCPH
jgi:hypothetical protein